MASLLIAAGVLSYTTVRKTRAKRASKRAFDDARFDELERDNAARIAQLQSGTCFCQRSDWRGGGCEVHGFVPPAAGAREVGEEPPGYDVEADGQGAPPPGPMAEDEVRRINEERRKRMRAGGFTNWVLRRKGRSGNRGDAAVVR